ncbi:MAG: cell division protein SepF [Clostridia bacterium]|nr:cell division protein SepF [Clostridia bacterium]
MAIFNKRPLRDEEDYTERYYEDEATAIEEEPAQNNIGFGGINIGGSSMELKVVRPETLADAITIADHLMDGRTVVLNMEALNKDVSLRLRDFLNGVAHAIGGQIRCVANTTYIATPNNVDITDTALRGDSAGE